MRALEAIESFGAGHAAAAVLGWGGVIDQRGDPVHRFQLASVTKLFTAYATLVACEEGTAGLEDPAGPPGATLAHLLAHASGLAPDREQPLTAPGTRRIYSNAGFELVAAHVASRSGLSFGEYLSEALFAPLGMKGAELRVSAASGAVASLSDCVAFAAELLAPRLLDQSTFGRATSVAFPGLAGVVPGFGWQDPCDWGLGFELRDGKRPHWTGAGNSPSTFGHFGRSGTFVWVDPERRLSLVVLTDLDFGESAKLAWPKLSDAVLSEAED